MQGLRFFGFTNITVHSRDHFTPGTRSELKSCSLWWFLQQLRDSRLLQLFFSYLADANLRINLFANAGCCSITWSSMACCFTSSLLLNFNIFQHAASTCHAESVLCKKNMAQLFLRVQFLVWFSFFFIGWICLFTLDLGHFFFCRRSYGPPCCQCLTADPAKWAHCSEKNRNPPRFIHVFKFPQCHPYFLIFIRALLYASKICKNHSFSFIQAKWLIHFLECSLHSRLTGSWWQNDWLVIRRSSWDQSKKNHREPHMQCNPKTRAAPNTPDTMGLAVIHPEHKGTNNASTNVDAHSRPVAYGLCEKGCQCVIGTLHQVHNAKAVSHCAIG